MSDYRAAVIGCGRMSRGHVRGYQDAGIPIVAGADVSEEALAAFRERVPDANTYTDYPTMLREVRPELVSIVTHDRLHCEMVVAAAEAGVAGIVCEKPMAMNLDQADRMLAACAASGARLTVSHQRYYMPQYARAIELIREGAIGRVRHVEAYLMPACIHTDGTHTIHMLFSLLGFPKVTHLIAQVDAHSGSTYYGHRAEDAGVAFLAYDSGQTAHLTWGLVQRDPNRSLHPEWDWAYHGFFIHGETGRLELDGDRPRDERPMLRLVRGGDVQPVALPELKSAIALEIEALIRTIETGEAHPLSGQTGRDTLEVIIAIYESARRRGVVRFPVEVRDNPFLAMCEAGDFPP